MSVPKVSRPYDIFKPPAGLAREYRLLWALAASPLKAAHCIHQHHDLLLSSAGYYGTISGVGQQQIEEWKSILQAEDMADWMKSLEARFLRHAPKIWQACLKIFNEVKSTSDWLSEKPSDFIYGVIPTSQRKPEAVSLEPLEELRQAMCETDLDKIRAVILKPKPGDEAQSISGPIQASGSPTSAGRKPKRGVKGKNVDPRMLKLIAEDRTRVDWSAETFATRLSCSPSTVKESNTWLNVIRAARALSKAEKISASGGSVKDRRRKGRNL